MDSMRTGVRAMLTRQQNAMDGFTQYVMERGFTRDQADHIRRVYLKAKVLKLDVICGQWNVKHGAFLDLDVLQRALAS